MTIAIWCILIAGTLPYVAFGLVKGLDPHQPRAGVAGLDGRAARAYGPSSTVSRLSRSSRRR
jgi:uncharacterized MAPEG superfamily protein